MAFFAMVVIGSVQPRQPPFDGVICKRNSLAEPLRIKFQHRTLVQTGPASVFVCWHHSGSNRAMVWRRDVTAVHLANETDPKLIRRTLHESEQTPQDPNTSDRKERFDLSGV